MTHFISEKEAERITTLRQYEILDTPDSRNRFGSFLNQAPYAAFTKNANGQFIYVNEMFERLFLSTRGDVRDITDAELFPPDIAAQNQRTDREICDTGRPMEFVQQIPNVDGENRIWSVLKFPFTDPAGEPCIGGMVIDITQRKQTEDATRHNESRFFALSNSAPVGIFETDMQGNCLYTNRLWEEMTGIPLDESLGRKWWNAVHPDDRDDVCTVWEICAEQGHDFYMDFRFVSPNSRICWVRSHAAVLYSDTGEMYVGTVSDITEYKQYQHQIEEQVMFIQDYSLQLEKQKRELEALNAKLQALAVTDGLTGLKNHRAFQEKLAEEFDRSIRYHKQLSLLLLDVDKFKHYNDTFGHPAGDQVLKVVAALLQETVRSSDFVARYGGEEFVILLPETDSEGAACLAERVRQAVASHSWTNREVTVSIGAAALRPACSSPAELLEQADQALYASKTGGRNRVTLFASQDKSLHFQDAACSSA